MMIVDNDNTLKKKKKKKVCSWAIILYPCQETFFKV